MECEICAFRNPKQTATAICIKDGKLLVVKRNQEPFKGKWDFVGGFLNEGELPLEALRREIKEELNVNVKRAEFLGDFPGTCSYKEHNFPIISSTYIVLIDGDIKLNEENSNYDWKNPNEIDIAFDSNEKILQRMKEMIVPLDEVEELVRQLDSSATVDEYNFYIAQLSAGGGSSPGGNGYISKKYDGEKLIGMGWIFPRQTALRKQAVVEDMIVDEKYRGKGYGKDIVLDLIRWAKENGVEVIELTSNPKRIAANELYKRVGFKLHPTNHYLLDLRSND